MQLSKIIKLFLTALAILSINGCAQLQARIDLPPSPTTVGAFSADDIDPEPLDIWDRIRSGFDLQDHDHPGIQADVNWYARHQNYLDRVADRAEPYLFFIMEELDKRDMPSEIALLPIVESAYHPFAYSHGRASGIWQFIPSTGRLYGMRQDWWYDGRRDIHASTIGALDYLQNLQRRFDGDWLLALAAYNSGSGTVKRAVNKNRRVGKPTDFWSIRHLLPKETRGYVPKLLAITAIVKSPEKYDITLKSIPDEPQITRVDIDSQIDLALAAELAEISLDELYHLNPGFNRWATAPKGPHYLMLPIEQAVTFKTNLSSLPPEQRLAWKRHKIRSGESLLTIAKQYRTTVDVLKQSNRIRGNTIRAGDHLIIPVASRSASSYTLSAEQRRRNLQNLPRNGKKVVHVVESGDTWWDLARRHNVSVGQLAKWNGMAPRDPLMLGQRLVIWSKADKPVASYVPPRIGPSQQSVMRRVGYTVRRGDSLARISQRFRVSINQLRKWNKLPEGQYLQPGQYLTLYVDVTRQSGNI